MKQGSLDSHQISKVMCHSIPYFVFSKEKTPSITKGDQWVEDHLQMFGSLKRLF